MFKIPKIIFALIFLIGFSLLFTFSSCKKEEEICYTCVHIGSKVVMAESNPETSNDTTTVEFCGLEDDANKNVMTYESLGYTCNKQ